MTRKPDLFHHAAPRDTHGTLLVAFMVALIAFTASMGWIVLSTQYNVPVNPVAIVAALLSGLAGVLVILIAAVL